MAPGLAGWTRTGPHCIPRPVNPAARSVNESQPGRGAVVSPLWLGLDQKGPGVPRPLPTNAPTMVQQRRKDLSASREHAIGDPLLPAAVRISHFSPFFSLPFLRVSFRSFRRIFLLLLFFFLFSSSSSSSSSSSPSSRALGGWPKKRWKHRENPGSEGFSVLDRPLWLVKGHFGFRGELPGRRIGGND